MSSSSQTLPEFQALETMITDAAAGDLAAYAAGRALQSLIKEVQRRNGGVGDLPAAIEDVIDRLSGFRALLVASPHTNPATS